MRYKIIFFILIILLLSVSGCTFIQSTEGPPRKAELAILKQELTRDTEGNVTVLVSVKNVSQVTVELAEVKVSFYDSQDNFIDSLTDSVVNLKPDDTWDFYIGCSGSCQDIKRYDVEVTALSSSGIP
ncbi:MAG: DUF3124 domain-containing protein [Dehalococcoidales bacterium]|nr:DUF3124 domain-containing protein [Dehalococcoidales bacterium]